MIYYKISDTDDNFSVEDVDDIHFLFDVDGHMWKMWFADE